MNGSQGMLSKRNQTQDYLWFHIYEILEKSDAVWLARACGREGTAKGTEEDLGDDGKKLFPNNFTQQIYA